MQPPAADRRGRRVLLGGRAVLHPLLRREHGRAAARGTPLVPHALMALVYGFNTQGVRHGNCFGNVAEFGGRQRVCCAWHLNNKPDC